MKRFTKQFSLIIALAMLVTVGGVYAQWSYTTASAVNDSSEKLSVAMQDYLSSDESAEGTITVLHNSIRIAVEDSKDANGAVVGDNGRNAAGDNKAELAVSGQIIYKFTPYNNTTLDQIKALPGDLNFSLAITNGTYPANNGSNIFRSTATSGNLSAITGSYDDGGADTEWYYLDETTNSSIGDGYTADDKADIDYWNNILDPSKALTANAAGSYIFVVEATDLKATTGLDLTSAFELDTLDKYHDFEAVLETCSFVFKISDPRV
ncbi:MAG: hypothetical protein IJW99_08520 [Clostridia bacterium]|nr:hypothetical protein [Clostridia bacterium]